MDEVIDAWLNLSLTDSKLTKALRKALCRNLSEGCVIGERWWPMEELDGMLESINGSAPEKEALQLRVFRGAEEWGVGCSR